MFPSTFRRLEVFITIVEAGGFAAAANRLAISHPSVSNHVKALEREIGSELFVRKRGSASQLSESGRRLYEHSTVLLKEIRRLTEDLAPSRATIKRQRMTIATQRILAPHVLRPSIGDFVRANPDVELLLDAGIFEQAIEALTDQNVDVCCVMTYGPIPGIDSEIIGKQRFGFFASPHHPLAAQGRVSVDELQRHAFVATRKEGHMGQMIHNLIASVGLRDYTVSHQIQEGSIQCEIAAQGRSVACGFVQMIDPFVQNGRLVEIPVEAKPMFADIRIAWPAKRRPSTLAKQFAEMLRIRLGTSSA